MSLRVGGIGVGKTEIRKESKWIQESKGYPI